MTGAQQALEAYLGRVIAVLLAATTVSGAVSLSVPGTMVIRIAAGYHDHWTGAETWTWLAGLAVMTVSGAALVAAVWYLDRVERRHG